MFRIMDIKVYLTGWSSIIGIGFLQRFSDIEPLISFAGQGIIWLLTVIYLVKNIKKKEK